jgi:hypothetical protein
LKNQRSASNSACGCPTGWPAAPYPTKSNMGI